MPRGSFAVLAASGAEIPAAWIAAGAVVLAALIGGAFVLAQQRILRRTEREKLELSDQLERERERRQDQRQAEAERERSEAEFQARLRDEGNARTPRSGPRSPTGARSSNGCAA